MVGARSLWSLAIAAARGLSARRPGPREPIAVLEDLDRCWNLPRSVAIVSFFAAAATGVLAFFGFNNLVLSAGIDTHAALLLVAFAWCLIFTVWVVVFLLIMTVLGAIGIRDLRSVARSGLADLGLRRDQLQALRRSLASRSWRHRAIFDLAVRDLLEGRPGP